MGAAIVRWRLGLIIVAVFVLQAPVAAEQCANSCARARGVCAMQSRIALRACLQGCVTGGAQCRASCMTALRTGRATCQATRADCMTTCPAPAARSASCIGGCSAAAKSCFAGALPASATCVETCRSADGAGVKNCLEQCAGTIGGSRSACLATFQGCVVGCDGQASGSCFSTTALACTTEMCGPDHACSKPDEFCSPRCSAPPPSGTCLELGNLQCTHGTCSPTEPCAQPGETCVPICPPPFPQGRCFDRTTKECSDQPCDPMHPCASSDQVCTWQCPVHTPAPPCASVPCGGPCAISPTCPPGRVCPEAAFLIRPGQCTLGTAGNCTCVPATPPPTPTPQCTDQPCGGPCKAIVPFPCRPDGICNGPDVAVREGQCDVTANGSCDCVPLQPTPAATPTPQCTGATCGGPCVISPGCPPGETCPEFPDRPGECTLDATGNCACVPGSPPPTPTAQATPTPQCSDRPCGGACKAIVPFPCRPDGICNGPDFPVREGQCALTANGGCDCVPILPTPAATATPQCTGATCGGPCVIGPICPPGEICPEFPSRPGQCTADSAGNCQCVPIEPPTPTAECSADADCNDGNSCTADRCMNGVCEHDCLCLTPTGEQTCCPGPAAFCGTPCGSDATGACGGSCPFGASCESGSSANRPCACVSGPGGPCGGNVLASPPVCAPGLSCHQTLPDVTGYCEKSGCVPLFTSGCSQTADCCEPCGNGTHAPCGVCINGTCEGAP